jgi:hypothetical protein
MIISNNRAVIFMIFINKSRIISNKKIFITLIIQIITIIMYNFKFIQTGILINNNNNNNII